MEKVKLYKVTITKGESCLLGVHYWNFPFTPDPEFFIDGHDDGGLFYDLPVGWMLQKGSIPHPESVIALTFAKIHHPDYTCAEWGASESGMPTIEASTYYGDKPYSVTLKLSKEQP